MDLQKLTKKELYDRLPEDKKAGLGRLKDVKKLDLIELLESGSTIAESGSDAASFTYDALDMVVKGGLMFRFDHHVWWGKTTRMKEDDIEAKGGRKVSRKVMQGMRCLIDPVHLRIFRSLVSYGENAVLRKYGYQFSNVPGVWWVPKVHIGTVEHKLRRLQKRFLSESDKIVSSFDELVKEWVKVMKEEGVEDLHNPEVYPDEADLRSRFWYRWLKFSFGLDSTILEGAEYEKAINEQKQAAKEFMDQTVTLLAQSFTKIVSTMENATSDGKGGVKQKTLDNFRKFTETFDSMNITNNAELKTLVKKAATLLEGVEDREAFKDEKFSAKINKGLNEIVAKFEKSADQRISRALEF